jgi:hypothetical protein
LVMGKDYDGVARGKEARRKEWNGYRTEEWSLHFGFWRHLDPQSSRAFTKFRESEMGLTFHHASQDLLIQSIGCSYSPALFQDRPWDEHLHS